MKDLAMAVLGTVRLAGRVVKKWLYRIFRPAKKGGDDATT